MNGADDDQRQNRGSLRIANHEEQRCNAEAERGDRKPEMLERAFGVPENAGGEEAYRDQNHLRQQVAETNPSIATLL
jgi:hypothetical protein